ncbi:MAG: hypothetical protein ACD_14C00033G0002 [uncultured bacterium]|nr:MAG: hypothetical protein ACD_14C00033G0002 [uncultured bacterium]KKQ43980.1 MAG: hypothetical protein US63_C0038G0004 [Candidatus Moranbacteria bacterium GW2011_GWC2_37_8]KKQ60403.1 MAG: YdjC-like protein [Parcubacteria group bacterium GW2011_GWC1_38_22]
MENISYESHRERLLIAADDFGISSRANRNILYLVSLGKINRVGVMTRGIISPREIEQLNRSGVKIDIHLDILHKFDEQRETRRGAVSRALEFIGKLLMGEILPSKVEKEWRYQIETFKEMFGRSPDGINSHEHVHFFPLFFKIALRLQKDYNIPYIRFGDSTSLRHNVFIAHILHLLRFLDTKACLEVACVSSTALVSLDWVEDMDNFLDNLPEGTVEIVCHPEIAEEFVAVKKYF